MDSKEILILSVGGILIMVNIWVLPLIPSFSLVSAYILVRYYEFESNKRLASSVALICFLLVFLLLIFGIYFPLGGSLSGLLIGFPIIILNVSAIFICLLLLIDFSIPLRKVRSIVLLGVLLYPALYIILFISLFSFDNFDTIGTFVSIYNEYIILLAVLLSLTLTYLLKLRNDYKCEEKPFEEFDSSFVKGKKIFKTGKENFGPFLLYIVGGFLLTTCIYFLFTAKDMRYAAALFYDLTPSIILSVWSATFIALSSKHKITDWGYIVFGAILIPFFFFNYPHGFPILPIESIIGTIRLLFGISFTLVLLGYDIRRVPRQGLIEYSIYGLSFLPLVFSIILVAVYTISTYLAMIFALLVLFKIIFTARFVHKRIGIE